MSSKLIHILSDGAEELLLLTPEMTIADVTETLLRYSNCDPDNSSNLFVVLTQAGRNIPLNNIEENDSSSPYVLKVLDAESFARHKREIEAKGKVSAANAKKHVHVSFDGNNEVLLITPKLSTDEITEMLLTSANLNPNNAHNFSISLIHRNGMLIPLTPAMAENTMESSYILKITNLNDHAKVSNIMKVSIKEDEDDVNAIRDGVIHLKKQLQELEDSGILHQKVAPVAIARTRHHREENKYVFTDETRDFLKTPSFDSWQWEDNEMMSLLELIFIELGVMKEFKIETKTLRKFLLVIKENYQENPFHNFRHCFCVTQMMYAILNITDLINKLNPIDKLVLVVSCIGHDLDHPGYNNAYQVNAKTDLAILYSDVSPLENHHCAMLFTILKNGSTNIFRNVPDGVYRDIRKGVIRCILATDMAKHGEIMGAFRRYLEAFNYDDPEHKSLLLQIIIKCADISNEVRPASVSEPWVDCLLEEFFSQSDREKREGLPTAPFMDRDKVTKPSAQIGFIGFVMIPLFELVGKILPQMDEHIILPIKKSLAYYKDMQDKGVAAK